MPKFIQPKPTKYRGIQFRSRLEARWAVFLDNASNVMKWQYEPLTVNFREGYTYTPDFHVEYYYNQNRCRLFIEVKPDEVTQDYIWMLAQASSQLQTNLAVYAGNPFFKRGHYLTVTVGKGIVLDGVYYQMTTVFSNFKVAQGIAAGYRFDLREK